MSFILYVIFAGIGRDEKQDSAVTAPLPKHARCSWAASKPQDSLPVYAGRLRRDRGACAEAGLCPFAAASALSEPRVLDTHLYSKGSGRSKAEGPGWDTEDAVGP